MPRVESEDQERVYAELARIAGSAAIPAGHRIFSMTWRHNGVEWTATVGETLRGTETKQVGRGRSATYREVPRSTDDTVLAIFSDVPYKIVHDNRSRIWNVPIYAGEPLMVTLFS